MRIVVASATALATLVTAASASGQELGAGPENSAGGKAELLEAQGAQDRRTFDIPAQPLSGALNAFGRQSGLQVTIDSSLAAGVQSQAVSGSMTSAEALNRLLGGTGITGRFTGNRTVVLTKPSSGVAPGAVQLDPVQVQGFPVPPQATIDNLPPPYAGGQVATGSQLGILGNRSVMDTPFNQTSYTSKLIQDQQAQTIGEVVKNDPSVRVMASLSSGLETFSIRGFDVSNADILFTGLANVTPTFFNSMMTEGIERVEVLKGPSAFLNGAGPGGSVGGVINIIPKRAGEAPITQFTPTYMSNAQFGGHIDVGRRFGENDQFGVRVNAAYRNGNTPIDNQTLEARLFTLGLDFRGDGVRGSADFGYQYQNLTAARRFPRTAFGVPVLSAPNNTTNFNYPWEFNANEVFYGAVRGEVDIVDNLTAFLAVGGSQRKMQNVSTDRTITNTMGTLAPTTAFIAADRMYGASLETGVRATFETGPIHHQATIAYNRAWREWRRGNFNFNFPVPISNLYVPGWASAPNPAFIPTPDGAPKRSESDLSSVVIGDTLSVWQERLQLTLGVRGQQIKSWNFNQTTGAVASSYSEAAATPMVGLVVKPWQNVSVYGNYIQGLQEGPVAPMGTLNAGQIFAPFISSQYEVGVKVDWGKLTTTLAAYQISQPSSFITPGSNLFVVDGEQRNRGLELNVFGEVAEGVRVLGGASYIDARLTRTAGGLNQGNYAIGIPPFQLVAGGEWDLPFLKGLTVLGRLVYDSTSYIDQMNVQQVPDWAQVNLGVRYAFEGINKKPIIVRLNVDNVFNANYWNATSFGQLSLSSPRTVMLSTSFNF